jgi:hypothetical protein
VCHHENVRIVGHLGQACHHDEHETHQVFACKNRRLAETVIVLLSCPTIETDLIAIIPSSAASSRQHDKRPDGPSSRPVLALRRQRVERLVEKCRAMTQLIARLPELFCVRSNQDEHCGGVVMKIAAKIGVDPIEVLKGKLAVLPSAPTEPTQMPTTLAPTAPSRANLSRPPIGGSAAVFWPGDRKRQSQRRNSRRSRPSGST